MMMTIVMIIKQNQVLQQVKVNLKCHQQRVIPKRLLLAVVMMMMKRKMMTMTKEALWLTGLGKRRSANQSRPSTTSTSRKNVPIPKRMGRLRSILKRGSLSQR